MMIPYDRPTLHPDPLASEGRDGANALRAQGGDATAQTLARCLWAHGGKGGMGAMRALASMVVNLCRTHPQRSPLALFSDPALFPCWREDHPANRRWNERRSDDPALAMAERLARRTMGVVGGGLTSGLVSMDDATAGAVRFHEEGETPPWAERLIPVAWIGGLVFYDDEA
jgi:hypothetical protein